MNLKNVAYGSGINRDTYWNSYNHRHIHTCDCLISEVLKTVVMLRNVRELQCEEICERHGYSYLVSFAAGANTSPCSSGVSFSNSSNVKAYDNVNGNRKGMGKGSVRVTVRVRVRVTVRVRVRVRAKLRVRTQARVSGQRQGQGQGQGQGNGKGKG